MGRLSAGGKSAVRKLAALRRESTLGRLAAVGGKSTVRKLPALGRPLGRKSTVRRLAALGRLALPVVGVGAAL